MAGGLDATTQAQMMEQLKGMDPSMLKGLMSEISTEMQGKGMPMNRSQKRKAQRTMEKMIKKGNKK